MASGEDKYFWPAFGLGFVLLGATMVDGLPAPSSGMALADWSVRLFLCCMAGCVTGGGISGLIEGSRRAARRRTLPPPACELDPPESHGRDDASHWRDPWSH